MDSLFCSKEVKENFKNMFSNVNWRQEGNHKTGSITFPFVVRKGQKMSAKVIEDLLQENKPRDERKMHKLEVFAYVETSAGLVKHRWGTLTVR